MNISLLANILAVDPPSEVEQLIGPAGGVIVLVLMAIALILGAVYYASEQKKKTKEHETPVKMWGTKSEAEESGWVTFWRAIGAINLGLGVISFVVLIKENPANAKETLSLTLAIYGIAGGVLSYFFAFLVTIFTDIRDYLKQIAERR